MPTRSAVPQAEASRAPRGRDDPGQSHGAGDPEPGRPCAVEPRPPGRDTDGPPADRTVLVGRELDGIRPGASGSRCQPGRIPSSSRPTRTVRSAGGPSMSATWRSRSTAHGRPGSGSPARCDWPGSSTCVALSSACGTAVGRHCPGGCPCRVRVRCRPDLQRQCARHQRSVAPRPPGRGTGPIGPSPSGFPTSPSRSSASAAGARPAYRVDDGASSMAVKPRGAVWTLSGSGVPVHRLGLDDPERAGRRGGPREVRRRSRRWRLVVAASRFDADVTSRALGYAGQVVEAGLPRMDVAVAVRAGGCRRHRCAAQGARSARPTGPWWCTPLRREGDRQPRAPRPCRPRQVGVASATWSPLLVRPHPYASPCRHDCAMPYGSARWMTSVRTRGQRPARVGLLLDHRGRGAPTCRSCSSSPTARHTSTGRGASTPPSSW